MSTDKDQIVIASDHNGSAAKNYIIKMLIDEYDVVDMGPYEGDGKVDYIDYAERLCRYIISPDRKEENVLGILICGTGTGMSIVANRFPGIRAAIVTDRATSALSKEHNNANVLVLGQWRTPLGAMDEIVETWLNTFCTQQRHFRRLRKLENFKV